ncbi:MAG TPA: AI-2E family transporter [Pyrinomonadaceae bacterium]|nr:AI-2E family transporter [Pyrinomonadaceae bacterium]
MKSSRDKTDNQTHRQEVEEVAETAAVAAAEATWPQTRAILRIIIIVLLVAALMWVLYKLEGVLLLLVLSVFFSYLIAPLVEFVRRPFNVRGREHIMPRAAAIGVVYFVLFGSLIVALWILLPKLTTQAQAFKGASDQFRTTAEGRVKLISDFCRRNEIPANACDYINGALMRGVTAGKDYIEKGAPELIAGVLGWIPWLILIPILSFFFLKDADDFRRSALQMLPRGRWRWRGDEFFQDVNSTLAAYIRAQLIACLLIGTICTLGFVALGVPFPLVIGVIAGFLEFIPLVGPLVVAIIAALVTSFSPDTSTYSALWVLLFLGVLRIIHDYTIYPRLVGQGVHLHPLAVILAILAGYELAGVAGIFLSIPLIAVATVSYRHWLEHRGSEGLVAEILQPVEEAIGEPPLEDESAPYYEDEVPDEPTRNIRDGHSHPSADTTPDEMARARPDLTTGELKMPKMD